MKKLLLISAFQLVSISAFCAGPLTPFELWLLDSTGNPMTNRVTIESWPPQSNSIVGLNTNLITGLAKTFDPTTNGYVFGYLLPNNYRLTIYGIERGATFGIPSSTSTQNLASLSGIPIVTFLNFTVAQLSDAGTASYSNATAFALRSYTGVTSALGITPATNSHAGIASALGYTPATNNYVAAADFGRMTNSGLVWLSTNLATGVSPTAALPNGSILTGTNGAFYVRSNGAWLIK